LFLRLTHAVSRHQELQADALAARIVGREDFVSGMKAVVGGSAAYDAYFRGEIAPLLDAGYRAPLAAGIAGLGAAGDLAAKVDEFVAKTLKDAESDPYDTHPPTRERIARVEAMTDIAPTLPPDARPAIALLRDLDRLESELLRVIVVNAGRSGGLTA